MEIVAPTCNFRVTKIDLLRWVRELVPDVTNSAMVQFGRAAQIIDRFPQQQPFELFEELICFSAAQLGLGTGDLSRSSASATRLAMESTPLYWNMSASLSGITLCSTASMWVLGSN